MSTLLPNPAAVLLSFALATAVAATASAQTASEHPHGEHDDDDHHAHLLHFSHPLVGESPSPDTKVRLDYLWARIGDADARATERGVRVEGEYAFGPGLSLAVTVPYVWRSGAGLSGANGFGNTELSLKVASLRWGAHGLLVGGGFSTGLPTGNDERGIGTSRAVELEPFVDAGLKRGGLQLVGVTRYGTTIRNPAGADAERELSVDGSVLYPVTRSVETLLEVEAARSVAAGEAHETATSLAPGLKLYPFARRNLMLGVSAPLGLSGEARDARSLVLSAFYHF